MASSAFPNRPFNLRENAWLIGQQIENNRSLVGWEIWIDKTGYSPTSSGNPASSWDFTIDGGSVGSASGLSFDFTGAGPWLLGTGNSWVNHNSDGTRTFDVAAFATYDILGHTSVTHNDIPLPAIPRASTGRFDPSSTITAGVAVTIHTDWASSSFTHDITYNFGSLVDQPVATGVGGSYAWTPPLSMLNQIPNSTSGGGSIKVVTKSGGTVIGSKLTSFTLLAPSSVIPTWTSVAQADPVTSPVNIPSIVGAYVQGLSKVQGTITGAAGVYSSTIASKNFTVAGQTVNVSGTTATTPNPITATGTVPVVFKITDSRGRIKTQTNNITVLPYNPPAITAVSLDRSTSAGVADVNGTYIKVDLNASVQSLMNSTERNRLTVKAYTSPIGAGTWTLRSTPVNASTTLTYNSSFWFTMSGGFNANTAYDVRVEVSDQFGVVLFEDTLTIGGLFLDFNEGLGVLKEWEQGSIDAEGEIYHRDGSLVEPVGIVSIFAGATAPAGWLICDGTAVSRTTYAALWNAIGTAYGAGNGTSTFNLPNLKGRIPVGLDTAQSEFNVLGETGGEKTHLLTADETGVSEHYHVIRGAGNATPGGTTDGQARGSGSLDSGFRTGGTASSATYGSGSGNRSAAQAHNNIQPYVTMNYIIKAL